MILLEKKLRAVFFDLDGTIIDSSQGIMRCFRLGLATAGITEESDELLRRVIGPTLHFSYTEYYGLDDEAAEVATKEYRRNYTTDEGGGYKECDVYKGVPELLAALKERGILLAIATTKPQVMAEKIAAYKGFAKYFDTIVGAELSGARSDKVELIECAIERLSLSGCSRDEIAMVGDRRFDMEGARSTGVLPVGVTWGFGSAEELEQSGARHIITASDLSSL